MPCWIHSYCSSRATAAIRPPARLDLESRISHRVRSTAAASSTAGNTSQTERGAGPPAAKSVADGLLGSRSRSSQLVRARDDGAASGPLPRRNLDRMRGRPCPRAGQLHDCWVQLTPLGVQMPQLGLVQARPGCRSQLPGTAGGSRATARGTRGAWQARSTRGPAPDRYPPVQPRRPLEIGRRCPAPDARPPSFRALTFDGAQGLLICADHVVGRSRCADHVVGRSRPDPDSRQAAPCAAGAPAVVSSTARTGRVAFSRSSHRPRRRWRV